MSDALQSPDLFPVLVLAVSAAATYFWRALGVAMSGRLRPNGPVMEFIGCVAYALLAGLVARMILLPIGPLQATGLTARLAAVTAAVAIYFICRRNQLMGVVVGGATLAALAGLGL